ncbi:MAG: hypothetical protein FJ267_00080 [Planctomycetes bacterium]|nr:hypothetical protein [Planctomycetota bacterium]
MTISAGMLLNTAETLPNPFSISWSLMGLLSSLYLNRISQSKSSLVTSLNCSHKTNNLATIDVGAVPDLLTRQYGKSTPDAALPRSENCG